MLAQWPQANEVAVDAQTTSLGSSPCSLSRIVQSDPKIDDVGKDGDHMDDHEQGEERVEKQVAELVTFLPTVCSAAGSRSIWGHPAKWSPYVWDACQ